MSILGVERKEKEESGRQPRQNEGNDLGEGVITAERERTRASISTRLRRNIGRISNAFAALTRSGRLTRLDEKDSLEDSREMVKLSLETLTDGLICIGAMAEAMKERFDKPPKINPYELVVEIIDHTARTIFDHPFFTNAGIGPNDTVMVEETETSIDILVKSTEGYKTIRCDQLFSIPEHVKPHLDLIIAMWSHFLGKEYDVSCFFDLQVFEKLEDLKRRANPLNKLFGGLIRAFDDAVDRARTEHQVAQDLLASSAVSRAELKEAPADKKTKHGIPQPFLPPPTLKQAHSEMQDSEKMLRSIDDQFTLETQNLIDRLLEFMQEGSFPEAMVHQIADKLPKPSSPEEECLNRIYRKIIPGSTINLLNPRTFLLSILVQWAELRRKNRIWNPNTFRDMKIKRVLAEVNPGELLTKELSKLIGLESGNLENSDQAAKLLDEFGQLASLATSAMFPKSSSLGKIATAEILCHEHLIRPSQAFSFRQRIEHSPIFDGERPTTEDKLCRLLIGLIEAMTGKSGANPGGISGLFFLITGNLQESQRWIKRDENDKPFMKDRCEWLQGVFQKYVEDEDIRVLAKAVFGLTGRMTKEEWSRKGIAGTPFDLIRAKARSINYDEAAVEKFKQTYDRSFDTLDMTIGELLDDIDVLDRASEAAEAIRAYWHKSLKSLLPILFGLLRAEPRLRGELAQAGKRAVMSYSLQGLQGPDLVSFLRGWEEKTGHMALPYIRRNGSVDAYFLKTKKQWKKP